MSRAGMGMLGATAALPLALGTGPAWAGKPNIMDSCKICHTAADGVVRGKMVSASSEFRTVSVTVGPLVWIVKYGDDLRVKEGEKSGGPDSLKSIPRDREIAVRFAGTEESPVATEVAVKQPYRVAADKLASLEHVQELVAKGPASGAFTLIDSRPGPMFAEGHIPGAVSLPYAVFKEKAGGSCRPTRRRR